jgi:tetratricopeptide (TPR) repeat protein
MSPSSSSGPARRRRADGARPKGKGSSGRPGPRASRGRTGSQSRRTGRQPAERRPPTAAERRAAEVRRSRGPRRPRDPEAERAAIEGRTVEEWVDEGALRAEAAGAAGRARFVEPRPDGPSRRRHGVDAETTSAVRAAVTDPRRAGQALERLTQAQHALERERFGDARRIATSLLRDLPDVAAVHQVLGLAAYRTGRWRQAVTELETARALRPSVELLPVLGDAYRALRRWRDVERIWEEVRAISPAPDVLAEARIVAAGAEADRGDLHAALRTMERAKQVPKRVRDHHLRQWYVLGDLYDRAGDPLEAARWFEQVARHDAEFVDVGERLRLLGR